MRIAASYLTWQIYVSSPVDQACLMVDRFAACLHDVDNSAEGSTRQRHKLCGLVPANNFNDSTHHGGAENQGVENAGVENAGTITYGKPSE